MKHNRNRAVKKERLNKNVKLNVATNFALAFLIFSVGFVCLFPVEDAVTTDGSEKNVYRSASAETDGVSLILSRGHELGNHGYFHKDHASLSEAQNKEEISLCNRFIQLMTGKAMTLFAPPSGAYGKAALAACETLNMKTILWSRDTIDWRDKNASLIYSRATKNIKGGEFVLMHPMKETADALDDILTYYETCSLRAVTVSENLQDGG